MMTMVQDTTPTYITSLDTPRTVVAVVTGEDTWELDTVVPNLSKAVEYLENVIDRWMKDSTHTVLVFSKYFTLDYKPGLRGWAEDMVTYKLLECNLDNPYENPSYATYKVMPQIKEYLTQRGYEFQDFTGR